jgi:integrase
MTSPNQKKPHKQAKNHQPDPKQRGVKWSPKTAEISTATGCLRVLPARQIDIAPELIAMLRQRREEAFRQGHAKPEDYVFATQIGTPLSQRNTSARGLEKGADRAGLNRDGLPRLGFHDLRHTAITHLIRSGADVAQVQRFAGHAKPSITLDLYVGEFERRKVNDSGARLAAIYGDVQ